MRLPSLTFTPWRRQWAYALGVIDSFRGVSLSCNVSTSFVPLTWGFSLLFFSFRVPHFVWEPRNGPSFCLTNVFSPPRPVHSLTAIRYFYTWLK